MPKPATALALVETATKCFATARSSPSRSTSQARAEAALVMVSCVVKVLEATTNSVRAGSSPARVSARCAPSTLDTKCGRRSARWNGVSAWQTMTGPRSEPPMPRLTMSVMVWPPWPRHWPPRTASVKLRIRARTALTAGMTSSPSTRIGRLLRLRSAICRTARSSVKLIRSPANIRSRQVARSACRASTMSRPMVSTVTRFLE